MLDKAITQGHVCYFYENKLEQTEFLVEYLIQGVDNNELCILIVDGGVNSIKPDIIKLRPQLNRAIDTNQIQIFDMKQVYLPNGSFSPYEMIQNLRGYIEAATKLGFSGLRTAGDLTWLHEFSDELEAVEAYEFTINKLITQNPNYLALCMYPVKDASGEISDAGIRSHPSILNKGVLSRSLLYSV